MYIYIYMYHQYIMTYKYNLYFPVMFRVTHYTTSCIYENMSRTLVTTHLIINFNTNLLICV
jgi:hypothetical protein